MSDEIVPGDGLFKIQPLLAKVYQETLTEQLRMQAKVYGRFTPEDEKRIAEAKVKRERERKELDDLLATATGTIKAVIELHSPTTWDDCQGCDYGGWEGESPAWPCRTIDLIAERLRNDTGTQL